MTAASPVRRRCRICDSDRAPVINSLLVAGRSAEFISREMKASGRPTKAETIRKHLRECLTGTSGRRRGIDGRMTTDFAQAVRDTALQMLRDGDLKVRTEHGLAAQGLIDRRVEKAADRSLQVELARLLTGLGSTMPGELVEKPPERNVTPALAPLELVSEPVSAERT